MIPYTLFVSEKGMVQIYKFCKKELNKIEVESELCVRVHDFQCSTDAEARKIITAYLKGYSDGQKS